MNDYKIIDTMHKVQDMIHDAIGNGGGAKLIIECIKKAF